MSLKRRPRSGTIAGVSAPQHCPTPRELDDLELLLSGAMAPRDRFDAPDGLVTLDLPEGESEAELVDPEGLPLAHVHSDGRLEARSHPAYGPFRRLHLTPEQARSRYADAVAVPLDRAPSAADISAIQERREGRPVLLLALTGVGTARGLTPVGLVRVALATARLLGNTDVVVVPLAAHDDATADAELREQVIANYATGPALPAPTGEGVTPDELAEIVALDQPAEPGLVVFFTGLSGSGKSTLARALHDLILEHGTRTVTSLDGDVVRRNLSAGLTFSREDRETNIRRIGWVAAEISRHRGVAICSPIAPFDATRKAMRAMVEEAGGRFVLIHVATPLEECERRDRKGLYAKARRGEIPDFTGISSPYEAPADADAVVDTTGRSIADALADVLAVLPHDLTER